MSQSAKSEQVLLVGTVASKYRSGFFRDDTEARGAFQLAYQQALDGLGVDPLDWMGLTRRQFMAWIEREELPGPAGVQDFARVPVLPAGFRRAPALRLVNPPREPVPPRNERKVPPERAQPTVATGQTPTEARKSGPKPPRKGGPRG